MSRQRKTKHPELYAEPYEPWIGVHALSEFVFCPRAGICSHDQAGNDDGEELDDRPGFYHMPIFFKEELDGQQTDLAKDSLISIGIGFVTLVCMVAAGFFLHPVFYIAAMLCGIVALIACSAFYVRAAKVGSVLKEWGNANSEVPGMDITELTVVRWPNFSVVDDYNIEKPQDVLRECEWKLAEKPWRVVRHGNRVIPVFLRNVTADSAVRVLGDTDTPQLFPQHFVRIAAYCHLIEASEGLESPYGIVLTRGSLAGIAIPHTKATREQFVAAMAEARKTMRDVAHDPHMRPVINEEHCVGCPHGWPVTVDVCFSCRVTDEEQKPRELMPHLATATLQDKKGNQRKRRYHSHCGDRFVWLPPHEKAARLELKK